MLMAVARSALERYVKDLLEDSGINYYGDARQPVVKDSLYFSSILVTLKTIARYAYATAWARFTTPSFS